jgi:hypothetical protein
VAATEAVVVMAGIRESLNGVITNETKSN